MNLTFSIMYCFNYISTSNCSMQVLTKVIRTPIKIMWMICPWYLLNQFILALTVAWMQFKCLIYQTAQILLFFMERSKAPLNLTFHVFFLRYCRLSLASPFNYCSWGDSFPIFCILVVFHRALHINLNCNQYFIAKNNWNSHCIHIHTIL